jgi:16S rRNA (guanine966-N2)-methyltransferase
MRIISGYLGGRYFDSPHARRTHPMGERIRGGLFSALGDISELDVLDVFAGSGALGLEALSRGAASLTAVEADHDAQITITANIEKLGLANKAKAVRAFFTSWSSTNESKQFDLVFADPPYDQVKQKDIELLEKHLKPSSLLVLSWPGREKPPEINKLNLLRVKTYGDSQLVFYRKIG